MPLPEGTAVDVPISDPPASLPALEQAVIRFIQGFGPESVSSTVRSAVSRLLRDQLAVQIGGSQMPWSSQALSYAISRHTPGRGKVVASDLRMSAIDAAFVNAIYGHAFEYDDAHRSSSSHPGCCVVPVAA